VKAVGLKALRVTGDVYYDDLENFVPASRPNPSSALRENDVLVAIRGSLPKVALVRALPSEGIFATGNIGVLRPGEEIDPFFLWASITALCLEPGAPKFRRISTGQMSVRLRDLDNLEIATGSRREQRELGRVAKSLRHLVTTQEMILSQSNRVFGAFLRERILAHG
jgi:hypothetical protein